MNHGDFQELLETGSRRALTTRERQQAEDWVATHPEDRPAWVEAAALRGLLDLLPEAPVSPQFTARVLARVEQEEHQTWLRGRGWAARWGSLLWGWRGAAAAAAVIVFAAGFTWLQQVQSRAVLAESVAAMSVLAELPDLEALAEFELVYHLPTGPLPDEQELARAFE